MTIYYREEAFSRCDFESLMANIFEYMTDEGINPKSVKNIRFEDSLVYLLYEEY